MGDKMAINYEKKGKIVLVTINRPQVLNAIDEETSRELAEAFLDFRRDDQLWVAILSGAGDKAFSVGADLKKMNQTKAGKTLLEFKTQKDHDFSFGGITMDLELWKPVIAAIRGYCLAGGLELALSCDFRIAAEDAVFGLPEVRWGVMPGAGGTQRLPRMISFTKALELILLGENFSSQDALGVGLINKIVPPEKLQEESLAWAEKICERGPLAIRASKEAIYRGLELSLREGMKLERLLAASIMFTEDAFEGPRAFLEKRKPEFKGR